MIDDGLVGWRDELSEWEPVAVWIGLLVRGTEVVSQVDSQLGWQVRCSRNLFQYASPGQPTQTDIPSCPQMGPGPV